MQNKEFVLISIPPDVVLPSSRLMSLLLPKLKLLSKSKRIFKDCQQPYKQISKEDFTCSHKNKMELGKQVFKFICRAEDQENIQVSEKSRST